MSMQLFSFGHPCEHQLHRACIGGSNCPLNGYPDTWCCSFIKGKINFKRDRPCEGPRCHWDFVHPSQSQFDEVTQVLEQSRPIAAKLDEAKDTDLLSFQINNPHIIDTVQCALHMMRHPPSTCARRVGQLLAYAAVQAGDQDVFVQLLKTMKKPVDGYILGAYAFLTQSKSGGGVGGSEKGGVNQKGNSGKKQSKKKDSKDDISATLANIMVELMNAALSLGGQLVDREDQHVLQAMLIKALSTYPKNDKRHQEMLEKAVAKFGNRKLDDEEEAAAKRETARREAAAAAATAAATAAAVEKDAAASTSSAAANAAATDGGETLGAPAAKEEGMAAAASTPPTVAVAPTTLPPAANTTATLPAVVTAAADAVSGAAAAVETQSGAAALPPAMPSAEREAKAPAGPSSERQTPRGTQEGVSDGNTPRVLAAAATPKTAFSSAPGTPGTAIAPAAAPAGSGPFHSPAAFAVTTSAAPSPQQALPPAISSASGATPVFTTTAASAVAGSAAAGAGARPPAPPSTASTATPAATTTAPTQPPAPSAAAAGPMVGISKIVPILRNRDSMRSTFKLWTWRRPPPPGPDLYLCGGQLTVKSHLWGPTPLGDATRQPILDPATLNLVDYMRTIDATHAANAARHEEAPSHHYDDVSGDSWIYDEYEWTDSDSDFEIFF